MSIYFQKGRGWKYDFTLHGKRHTSRYYKTKTEAKREEAQKKEEILNPPPEMTTETIQTDMAFLDLVNGRLDHVKAYKSESYYQTNLVLARGWIKKWGKFTCKQVSRNSVESFILLRRRVSAFTANKEIRYLKAAFNFGIKKGWVSENPVKGIDFLPMEKKIKYVPPPADIDKVITAANQDTQDYLWTIRDTMGRISEINRLTWDDINLESRYVILYTRKKRGGHLTPRKVPMTQKLYEILFRRFFERDQSKPWVFWHTYLDRKTGEQKIGPFKDRREIFNNLKKKVGVRNFGFHALRHAGASMMDNSNVPIGAIQRILGHENRTTTEIYLHSISDSEREAIAIYERARESHSDSHSDKEKGLKSIDLNPM